MKKVVFFDADALTQSYLSRIPMDEVEPVFFKESLSQLSDIDLKPFLDVSIISVFPHSEIIGEKNLARFPNLKLIATRSTGFNHIEKEYCQNHGILIMNVPNYGENTVAEFTIGVMINLARKIYQAKSAMKQDAIIMENYIGIDLFGRTLGVVGAGAIGRRVIELALGFKMDVLVFDPLAQMKIKGAIYVDDVQKLFEKSDIVSLHCPATPDNVHIINAAAIARMKPGVLIVNTARGSLIDSDALYMGLLSGHVGGAALDVLENEDFVMQREVAFEVDKKSHDFLVDSIINMKLMQMPNTIITPHVAFNSIDAIHRILNTTLQNIHFFLKGSVQNVVL